MESRQYKPISITHESDLHFWGIKQLDIDMINPDLAFNAMRLLDSKVNDIFVSRFSYFLFVQAWYL